MAYLKVHACIFIQMTRRVVFLRPEDRCDLVDTLEDIMAMEQEMLRYTFARLQETCGAELSLLKAEVPVITEIPRIRFSEAKAPLRVSPAAVQTCTAASPVPSP